MSLGIGQQRRRSTVQSRWRSIVDQIARDRASQIQIETLDFQGWQRMSSDRLKYNDSFLYGKIKDIRTKFFLPKEPDFQYLTCWLKLDHIGRFIEDASGFNTDGYVKGYPKLRQGIDTGTGGSVYLHFNGTTDFIDVPDSPKIRTSAALSGFSISFRLYPESIEDPGEGKYRKVACKRDDSNNAFSISVLPDGRLRFTVMVNGVRYSVQTDPDVIVPDVTAHDCNVKFLRPVPQINTKLVLLDSSITVSGEVSPYVKANMNDANPNSYWSNTPLPQWVKIDLGSSKRVSRVAIHWNRGIPLTNVTYGFTIETSPDNSVWTKQIPTIGENQNSASAANTGFEYYDIIPNIDTQYIRININTNSTEFSVASIKDLQVWGSDIPGVPGSAQTQAIYVNNVKYTTATSLHDDLPTDIENELHIARGSTITGTDYKWLGGIHDFRYWKNKLYTDTEVENLWTNKQTILDVPIGTLAFAGQFLILAESEDYGFDVQGYDPTGVLAD